MTDDARDWRASERRAIERRALAEDLVRLLGRDAPMPMDDALRADALAREFVASREAALPDEWALVRRTWDGVQEQAVVDTLHRLARNAGAREAWLLVSMPPGGAGPHAAAIASELVLDNPLGFAAMADGELRLLDQAVPGGLWLQRHAREQAGGVRFTWELEVWGEPWLSAATRAFRGVG